MKAILGLNCYKHDAAAALLVDGRLVAAVEEERLRRIKHYPDYPAKAIDYALEEAGLTPGDIDHIAFYMLPGLVFRENLAYSRNYVYRKSGLHFLLSQLNASRKMKAIGETVRNHLGPELRAQVHFVEHHIAHADAGHYCSGFEEAAVLTVDGVGERCTSLLGSFGPDGHRIHASSRFPNSPGMYYSSVTSYLGFTPDNDEYKVMGLSSYGEPEFLPMFRRIISRNEGSIHVERSLLNVDRGIHAAAFSDEVRSVIGPPRVPGTELTARHRNIACSAQRALEEVVLGLALHLRKVSGLDRLIVSGGVGLNCVMNGLLEKQSGFSEVYPLPPSHDAGTSIGAAVRVHRNVCPDIPLVTPPGMYLGPSFTEREIADTLEMARLGWSRPEDPADRTAELVEQGKVVGLFHGRMEFGPRALGNRSILADPRRTDMKDIVNRVVKHREDFRPFCPSCLEEHAGEYFEGCTSAPYMIKTYDVVPGREDEIPAVTHVDRTARVQTVTRESNQFYYDVINSFYRRTGVPVILNTSFNIRGEPIVTTPVDAIRCFYGTGIDALVMPPFLIEKTPGRKA